MDLLLKRSPASPPRSTRATSTAASCFTCDQCCGQNFAFASSTGPSAGLRGFIFEILARQRVRDSCEVTVAVRKGEAREQGEVEKARRDDTDEEKEELMKEEEEEEELMRIPSPIVTPTLCISSFLKSLNITSPSILVSPLICVDSVPTGK